ncbi:MAG: YCF48-related protein [Bacteroidales bacterium]|nr:YCF48-related protein [Bacteroidales bacterium]
MIFAGSPSGGLWQTEDGGESWISYTDDLPTLGVSAIAIDYENPEITYIGTGDRDAGDALGIGIMKSYDGGQTWELFNNGMDNATAGRLLIDPDNPETLLAATSYGIYRTEDGAVNWTQKQSGNFKDLVFHPENADIVYATSSGNFYRSEDRGETWNEITSGLPGGSRGAIAVTPGEPDYVYFVLTNQTEYKGMYFSDNAGLSFQSNPLRLTS